MASLSALIDESSSSSSSAESEKTLASVSKAEPLKNPVVVVCGATNFDAIGDTKKAAESKATALWGPHRLVGTALDGVVLREVVSGPTSCHSVAISDKGKAFTWGRNKFGQLGTGDEQSRNAPTPVTGPLAKEVVVAAACGKTHTVFVTAKGSVFACGECKFGCVGPGAKKKDVVVNVPVLVPGISGALTASCGTDFTMVVTSSGALYSWGWSEFGQLGHGTDGSYNQSASSVKMTFEAEKEPRQVPGFTKKVVQVSCGPHHTCALQEDGTAFSWGYGGYGRLGHNDQADQWRPKEIPSFRFKSVSSGNAWTMAVGWRMHNNSAAAFNPSGSGMLHMWGRINPSKDSHMYPKPEYDVQGWNIARMCSSHSHAVLFADDCTISWGPGSGLGELGYGEGGGKSSAKPKKVDALEGATIGQVACGMAHTVWLVESGGEGAAKAEALLAALPEFTPLPDVVQAADASGGGKREAAPAKGAAGKKKAKK